MGQTGCGSYPDRDVGNGMDRRVIVRTVGYILTKLPPSFLFSPPHTNYPTCFISYLRCNCPSSYLAREKERERVHPLWLQRSKGVSFFGRLRRRLPVLECRYIYTYNSLYIYTFSKLKREKNVYYKRPEIRKDCTFGHLKSKTSTCRSTVFKMLMIASAIRTHFISYFVDYITRSDIGSPYPWVLGGHGCDNIGNIIGNVTVLNTWAQFE